MFNFKDLLTSTFIIQTKTVTKDEIGSEIEDWQDTGTFKGRIDPAGGNTDTSDKRYNWISTHVIYCYDDNDLVKSDRILYNGSVLEIVNIRDYFDEKKLDHIEIDIIDTGREAISSEDVVGISGISGTIVYPPNP
jgi:head-tail adaptor